MKNRSLKPYLFNKKAGFGTHMEQKVNQNNGNITEVPVIDFSLWCAPDTRTMNQEYKLDGTKFSDTITIIVHHNKRINDDLVVTYQGNNYKIVDISADDSNNFNTYDYLTLEEKR